MDKRKLKDNLLGILKESNIKSLNLEITKFKVKPITEPGKNHNSIDDVVRLWAFKDIDFEKTLYPVDELVKILSVVEPKFPLWINVDTSRYSDDKIIYLEISMRFRKPSQLLNKEFGFPPFKLPTMDSNFEEY